MEALSQFQYDCVMNMRCAMSESSQHHQIYWWTSKYVNAIMINQPYTHEGQKNAVSHNITAVLFYPNLQAVFIDPDKTFKIILFMKDAAPLHENLQDKFGVPE
eukprot:8872194-Ditylum_brightwellii.AAC.1